MYILTLLFIILFTIKGTISLDSDFGWHIRMGQIILQSGIPTTDPLSYTMPSYPFVDHEWLTNVGIATLYPIIGMTGLALLSAICVAAALCIQIPVRLYRYAALPILLIAGALFPISGVRTQVISWLLCSVSLWIIYKHSSKKYFPYTPILIMLIWSNLHGAFPLGLVIFALFFITRWIEQKKISIQEFSIILISIMVTFINPYGYRLWWEVWMQISDASLRWSILEWMPSFLFVNIALWMYVVISAMTTFRYRRKFSLFQKSIYVLFLMAGISSLRHMPLWIIISLYPTIVAFELFYKEISEYTFGKQRLHTFYTLLLGIAVFCLVWTLGLYFSGTDQNQEDRAYPKKALVYIKNNLPKGQMYAPYEWGGYLEWKLPEKKMFIDGRMPSFRRKETILNESKYVFKEYQRALYGDKKEFTDIMKKYSIEMVLMPKNNKYIKGTLDIALEKFIESAKLKKSSPKPNENKFKDLKIVYQDEVATIYTIKK